MASVEPAGPRPTAQPAGDGEANALEADWLELCRRAVAVQSRLFEASPGIAARTVYEGVGEGGDRTLEIDRQCEDAVFAELERLAEAGAEFTAISEERGEVAFGDGSSPVRVVIDPLDGSLNARRTIPSYALSVAVASGTTMADVEIGFVHDFGSDEEFFARRGEGAVLGGVEIRAAGPDYGLEVVGVETARPEAAVPLFEGLSGKAFRTRGVGSIALSLCYVAAGRFDAMLTGRPSRSVDAAAGQLIAREAGAVVDFLDHGATGADLSLDARYHVAAGLDEEMLETVLDVQRGLPGDDGGRP